jgi:hypothetical protein
MERATIGPGQNIVINVTLKNVSGKDIACYQTNRDDLRFVEVATKTVWVTQASLYPPPPASPPSLSTMKADEAWPHEIRLDAKARFAHPGDKPENARIGLPPGRYRLEYSTTFVDHYPEWSKDRKVYTGMIQANPIEFEITDEPTQAPTIGRRISMKGWELRIWQEKGMTYFSLLEGTNRLKTEDEITEAAVKEFDAIKARLDQLKPGEMVIISGTRSTGSLPKNQADLVRAYCRKIGLKVQ